MTVTDFATAPSTLGPECNGMLLTPEEYDSVDEWEAGFGYELVNGVLVVSATKDYGTRAINDRLGYLVRGRTGVTRRGISTVYGQTIRCGDNRRRVDRAIWVRRGDAFDPDHDTPAIAIEFVSESSRDRRRDYVDKRAEYSAAGVQEYWVINRFTRELTVFRGDEVRVIAAEESYRSPRLPGFALTLTELLKHAPTK